MDDALNLILAQILAAPQLEDHGCGGGFFFLDEQGPGGHDDVHPGAFHFHQGVDGSAQLSLERPLVINVLHELGHSQAGVVEKFKTDRTT